MEIQKKNRFVEFFKTYGMYCAIGLMVFVVALTFTLMASLGKGVQTSTENLNFALPMQEALLVKDFSNQELQKNDTLNQWEAHLAVDLASDKTDVYSVLDGKVAAVNYDILDGHTIKIEHASGLVSIYSSLDENLLVKVGDKVGAGQKIGSASESATGEADLGGHLHFSLQKDGKYVDPNDYLDLQSK